MIKSIKKFSSEKKSKTTGAADHEKRDITFTNTNEGYREGVS